MTAEWPVDAIRSPRFDCRPVFGVGCPDANQHRKQTKGNTMQRIEIRTDVPVDVALRSGPRPEVACARRRR
jgi:hypothetical protein